MYHRQYLESEFVLMRNQIGPKISIRTNEDSDLHIVGSFLTSRYLVPLISKKRNRAKVKRVWFNAQIYSGDRSEGVGKILYLDLL